MKSSGTNRAWPTQEGRNYVELKESFDALIRTGHQGLVRSQLLQMKAAGVPRPWAADFANLARRVGLIPLALKVLKPIVRSEKPLEQAATVREMASYAASLSAVGAAPEALELLQGIHDQKWPEVQLYSAFAHIWLWEYAKAIPFLKRYLRMDGLTPYQFAVAQLNLAAAYRFTDQHEAEMPLLEGLRKRCRQNQWKLLERDALILSAQSLIVDQEWRRARNYLERAIQVSEKDPRATFLIRKWAVLLDLHRLGRAETASGLIVTAKLSADDAIFQRMWQIREEALALMHWETVREIDFYGALFKRDKELLRKVFFGTPYEPYRERLRTMTSDWNELPQTYCWHPYGKPGVRCLDLAGFSEVVDLSTKQMVQKLFQIITRDFYRPIQTGTLFNRLHPGEYYDPFHSAGRVRTLVTRGRQWFENNGYPIDIVYQSGGYRLVASDAVDILVSVFRPDSLASDESEQGVFLQRLKQQWPYKAFSSQQACEVLQLPIRKTRRFLAKAVETEELDKIGQRRSTLFKFAK